jgi:hypothetical protein
VCKQTSFFQAIDLKTEQFAQFNGAAIMKEQDISSMCKCGKFTLQKAVNDYE